MHKEMKQQKLTFVVFLYEKKKENFSEDLLLEHLKHLVSLKKLGILELCGPFKDDTSAIQILHATSMSEAKNIAQSDPFIQFNYYQSFKVKELIEANSENNWLMSHSQTEEKRTQ